MINRFAKNAKISFFSHFVRLRKCRKVLFAKFRFNLFREKMQNFAKKYGREIICSDMIKLLMLSSESRECHKFFGQLIVAATTLIVFAKLYSHRFRIFSYFLRNFSFTGNPKHLSDCFREERS